MRRVLITGAGGAAAISVYKSLVHCDVEIFMADMSADAPGLFLVDKEYRILLPRGDSSDFTNALLRSCLNNQIDVVFPTVDAELSDLSKRISEFSLHDISLAISEHASIETCLDKFALMQACDGHIPLANYSTFDENFDPTEWKYPVIMKPRTGSGSRDIHLINSQEDLLSHERDENILIQEYLPGAEYSVDVFVDKENICRAAVPRERMKTDSGIAIVSKTLIDSDLSALARKVASVVGLTSVANIQFKRDAEGVAKLLEVNARFSGTMPLTIASGVDMPRMVIDEMSQELLCGPVEHKEIAVVRYLQEKFITVDELNGAA